MNAPNTATIHNSPTHDNDTAVEARFRLQLFALLRSPEALQQLLKAPESAECSVLRLDLARFVAGYYLDFNFAAPFAIHQVQKAPTGCVLPNLLLWSELNEQSQNSNKIAQKSPNSWERAQLGQLLSAQCSPQLALLLLVRERRPLEAVLFVDHFNDSRSAMGMRFFVDCAFGLEIFPEYCLQLLVDNLVDAIESTDLSVIESNEESYLSEDLLIQRYVEAAIQADALFHDQFVSPNGFLANLLLRLAQLMASHFGTLLGADDGEGGDTDNVVKRLSPLLPRPPIYCSLPPMENEENFGENPEALCWSQLHKCCTAISQALGRANRLDALIGFFALWLARSQDKEQQSDLPLLLETQLFAGHSDEEIGHDLLVFQTLLSTVLAMDLRDRLVQMITQGAEQELVEKQRRKLATMTAPFECDGKCSGEWKDSRGQRLVWDSLRSWAKLADQPDFDSAALFLHTLQQRNQSGRRFLPPLNAQNRPKWYSTLLAMDYGNSDGNSRENGTDVKVFGTDEEKYKLSTADMARLHYLAHQFPTIPLNPPLIQMLIPLDVHAFCTQLDPLESQTPEAPQKSGQLEAVLAEFHATSKWPLARKRAEFEEKSEKDEEVVDLEVLAEQIRAAIRRLEALEEEQKLEEMKEEKAEELTQFEIESSSDPLDKPKSQTVQRRKQWQKTAQSSQSSHELRTRNYAAFLRAHIQQSEAGIRSQSSSISTTSPPVSSSSTSTSRISTTQKLQKPAKALQSESEETAPDSLADNENEAESIEDARLMREMDRIGERLQWLWAEFERRKLVVGEEEEIEENGENAFGTHKKFEDDKKAFETHKIHENEENKFGTHRKIKNEEKAPETHKKIDDTEIKWIEEEENHNGRISQNPAKTEEIDQIEAISAKTVPKAVPAKIAENRLEFDEENLLLSARVPSSAGYHSSASSSVAVAGGTRRIEAAKSQDGIWERPVVERMDFSGLRSDSEEEDVFGQEEDVDVVKKKMARRKWTEIEVYPRHSPEPEPSEQPIAINPSPQKPATKPKLKKKQWHRPQWLRLLPPFDGAIRTERAHQKTVERPLLQLKLDGLDTLGTSRRTFLDMASRQKAAEEAKKHVKKVERKKAEDLPKTGQKSPQKQQQSVYDSGIGLDQQNQPVVLYSVEMDAEEVEQMRRMAKRVEH